METLSTVVEILKLYSSYGKVLLKKLKVELPHDPANPRLGLKELGFKRTESRVSKRNLYTQVHCSTDHNSQEMEATQMSINRGRL